jgi:rare lipoprotein A
MFSRAEDPERRGADGSAEDDGGPLLVPVRVERHRLVFALATTLAAIPILVLDNAATADTSHATVAAIAPASRPPVPDTGAVIIEITTTTTAAPTTTTAKKVTTTTKAPAAPTAAPKAQVKAKPITTTTRAPAPTTTVAPKSSQDGQASWYDHQAGGCAHRTLPMGTSVRVTNLANGKVATCVVNDRGPFNSRIIDLDRTVFSQLAPTSAGVINVRIEW